VHGDNVIINCKLDWFRKNPTVANIIAVPRNNPEPKPRPSSFQSMGRKPVQEAGHTIDINICVFILFNLWF
jgi:hypothetical protein